MLTGASMVPNLHAKDNHCVTGGGVVAGVQDSPSMNAILAPCLSWRKRLRAMSTTCMDSSWGYGKALNQLARVHVHTVRYCHYSKTGQKIPTNRLMLQPDLGCTWQELVHPKANQSSRRFHK